VESEGPAFDDEAPGRLLPGGCHLQAGFAGEVHELGDRVGPTADRHHLDGQAPRSVLWRDTAEDDDPTIGAASAQRRKMATVSRSGQSFSTFFNTWRSAPAGSGSKKLCRMVVARSVTPAASKSSAE